MNIKRRRFFQWLIVVFSLSFSAYAQQTQLKPSLTTVENYKLNSKLTTREMPYRVVLPASYKTEKTQRYSVIYLLHGLTGHFGNWADKAKLAEYATKYNYIFVTPEGDNSWYSDSASVPNDKYESYIIQELIPEIDKNFRTVADRNHRAVAGLSMGGYGSVKFGLKYPEMFSLIGSFSGALGAASWTDKNLGGMKGVIPDSIMSVFGAEDSATRKQNDIFQMVREISPEKIKTLPFIYQSCGTEDFLIANNHDFSKLLLEKKIPHEFRETPGIHDWKFWNEQIKEFLEVSEQFINSSTIANVDPSSGYWDPAITQKQVDSFPTTKAKSSKKKRPN